MVFSRNFRAGVFFNRSYLRVGYVFMLRRERLRVGKTTFTAAGVSSAFVELWSFVAVLAVVVLAAVVLAFAARLVVVAVSGALEHPDAKARLVAIADKIKNCFIFSPVYFYFAD
jgi:hypothetical protein